nr:retrotransposon protein, putative, Ty1-copia subclass [Tanacetum cinerariifolium]
MFVIENPILPAPVADSEANVLAEWDAVYDAYNEVACLMLEKEGKPVAEYVLKMKGCLDQPERLGYVLPQDLSVGLILNGLTRDFIGFVRNYNMHNIGKTIGVLHAMLIKALKSTDDESFDQFVSCLSGKMTRKSFPHHPKRATDLLGIIHTDVCGHLDMCQDEVLATSLHSWMIRYGYVYLLKHKHELTPSYTPQHNSVSKRRNRTLLDMVRSMMNLTTLSLSFWDYALESATRILNMVPTKKVDKNLYELWYAEFFEKSLITQKVSGRAIDLEEIQDEDTPPSKIISEIPMEVKGFEPPQEEVILICMSERTHRAPNRLCLNVEVEEHSLGVLNEPTNYKVAMLDPESNKWLDAINTKMQSMIENKVWVLVDLPQICKTVGSKWIFKKKTDMDGIVHNYKARLIAKGYTQLYEVDYEETFSPVADIRAIRILISIAAFYDYKI